MTQLHLNVKTHVANFAILVIELMALTAAISVFGFLSLNYYNSSNAENWRFVRINFEELEKEASAIQVQPAYGYAKNVFVLNYHVVTKNNPSDIYDISYEDFKNNMFALKKMGYQTITLNELYAFLRGEKQLPDKSFVLTFDDGATAAYRNVDPILKILNYTAVMFVITGGSLGEQTHPYYSNESELIEMQNTGRWELESHTHKSHFRLPINSNDQVAPALTNKLWLANENRLETDDEYINRVSTDLNIADTLLEKTLNKKITSFALPFGDFGERGSNYNAAHDILYNLTTSRYKMIFYQFKPTQDRDYRGNYNDEKTDSYLVVRLSVDLLRTPNQLLKEIEASRAIDLPYVEDFSNDNKWPRIAGKATFLKDQIVMQNGSKTGIESMMAYLDGSYLWQNYKYSIQLKNSGANTVMLIARYKSLINYAACMYNKGYVKTLHVKNGIPTIINEQKLNDTTGPQEGNTLSIKVENNTVTCSIDEVKLLTSEIPDMPVRGGVGIRAEGFEKLNRRFKFGNIRIENTYSNP